MTKWEHVVITIEGIRIELSVCGNDDMTREDFEQRAREEVKARLLNYWNAYCE